MYQYEFDSKVSADQIVGMPIDGVFLDAGDPIRFVVSADQIVGMPIDTAAGTFGPTTNVSADQIVGMPIDPFGC